MFSLTLNNKSVSLLSVATLMLLILSGMQTLQGQGTSATLSGIVEDETGGVLPGVSISVQNLETGAVRTAVTDDTGLYRVPLLEPGIYEIRAELTGFQTTVQTGVKLQVGGSAAINLSLSVGQITDEVIVTGEAPLVETTSTTLGGIVDDKKIRDLPLNGRSYEQLAYLQPGVHQFHFAENQSVTGNGEKFSVGGSRPNQNNFLLDGLRINDGTNGTPGSAAGVNLGVEAIREFSVLTNTYSANYGHNSGATINVVTKSGTNQLHGSIFYFHRNDNLDARNFYDQGESPPEFRRNQFGFSLGGPIKQDQTFIFGSYEGLREGLGLSNATVVPNEDAHQGIGPWGFIDIPPEIQPWVDLYPLPNGQDFGDGTAEFFSGPQKATNEDYFSIRFDHQFSSEDSLFARYTFSEGTSRTPDNILVTDNNFFTRNQSFVVEEKHIFSPNVINTVRIGVNRTFSDLELDEQVPVPPPFIPGQQMGRIIIAVSTGRPPVENLGGTQGSPYTAPYTTFQYADDLNWTRGIHGIQLGTKITRIQNNLRNTTGIARGQFSFGGLETFLRGTPFLLVADIPGSTRDHAIRQTLYGFYIQDDIRYRPNLTFNLGFRWEFMPTIRDNNGREAQQVTILDDFTVGLPRRENLDSGGGWNIPRSAGRAVL